MTAAKPQSLSLSALNRLDQPSFVAALGDIFEHSPWVSEAAYAYAPFESIASLHRTMMDVVRTSAPAVILALFRSHPDLATRLKIGDYSTAEQRGVGLDRLTPEEFERFSALNKAYVDKFGFPFLFAVRGRTKDEIVEAMERRIPRTFEEEREQALREIERITGFRLRDLIVDDIVDSEGGR
ncbi:2-oxo-4-hydroxy-4-carboxy-5-ureidoimidazoline decarboxylase [Paenibacillus sp. TRM 82003]|nr:2-oxo-4-hydroxy-4-carboxy-5-ureidoimidazoline decarboxylase [Paenibacillus sp. TRM 82003]